MKATTAKAIREARRRLALSRQFADPVMRQKLDELAVEAATREYVRQMGLIKAEPVASTPWWRRALRLVLQ